MMKLIEKDTASPLTEPVGVRDAGQEVTDMCRATSCGQCPQESVQALAEEEIKAA